MLEVSEKDIQNIVDLLEQTSIKNKEISLQIKARFRNKRQMYNLKLHTLWTPLKKDGYIGIIGYFDMTLVGNCIRSGHYWFKECGILCFRDT